MAKKDEKKVIAALDKYTKARYNYALTEKGVDAIQYVKDMQGVGAILAINFSPDKQVMVKLEMFYSTTHGKFCYLITRTISNERFAIDYAGYCHTDLIVSNFGTAYGKYRKALSKSAKKYVSMNENLNRKTYEFKLRMLTEEKYHEIRNAFRDEFAHIQLRYGERKGLAAQFLSYTGNSEYFGDPVLIMREEIYFINLSPIRVNQITPALRDIANLYGFTFIENETMESGN